MSRIINKLVDASGGWEAFLYKTLKDVVDKVGEHGFTGEGEDAVKDAQEILEAYEQLDDRVLEGARKEPVVRCDNIVLKEIKVLPSEKTEEVPVQKTFSVVKDAVFTAEDVEWKLEDLVLFPAPRPKSNPKKLTGRIAVDRDMGSSSGELPVPSDHKLVNRELLSITTLDGMRLGEATAKSGEEGQIKSQYVTGHVSVTGKYRLVFADSTLGAAHVVYDVVALPTKVTSKQFEDAVALANKLTVAELQERLKHFGMVYTTCLCGQVKCFGWKIIDKAEVQAVAAERDARISAARNAIAPGGPPNA